jgi:hypothetical protein
MPHLHRYDRILWAPDLTALDDHDQPVDPQPTAWVASFDKGATWILARPHPGHGRPCWLIQGPDAPDGPAPDATLSDNYGQIWIRLIVTPEALHTTIAYTCT